MMIDPMKFLVVRESAHLYAHDDSHLKFPSYQNKVFIYFFFLLTTQREASHRHHQIWTLLSHGNEP